MCQESHTGGPGPKPGPEQEKATNKRSLESSPSSAPTLPSWLTTAKASISKTPAGQPGLRGRGCSTHRQPHSHLLANAGLPMPTPLLAHRLLQPTARLSPRATNPAPGCPGALCPSSQSFRFLTLIPQLPGMEVGTQTFLPRESREHCGPAHGRRQQQQGWPGSPGTAQTPAA